MWLRRVVPIFAQAWLAPGFARAVEQHLIVTGLELLHVALVAQVPIGQRELVGGANDARVQVVASLLEPQLGHGGADIKQGQVIVAVIMVVSPRGNLG